MDSASDAASIAVDLQPSLLRARVRVGPDWICPPDFDLGFDDDYSADSGSVGVSA